MKNNILNEKLIVRSMYPAKIYLNGGRVLYGETYDMLGITVDSLKYYLFLEYLSRRNSKFKPVVMEADLHAAINASVKDKNARVAEGVRRVLEIKKILMKLNCQNVKVKLMSELVNGENNLLVNRARELVANSVKYQKMLEKTVLINKVAQERQMGFRYGAEEIGLVLNFDVKVGPPRERNYDLVAREIAKELGVNGYDSIYLRPSYPFTADFSYYLTHPEIEEYGLTPYKAGSNKLQDQRIVLGVTSEQMIRNLIISAFIPLDIAYANPIVDLASIVAMKEQIKQDNIDVLELGKQIKILVINREQLVSKVIELIREII